MEIIVRLIEVIVPLIWTAFLIALFFWFRKPVQNLFPLIRTIKYGDLEISFSEDIARIREDLGETLTEEQKPIIDGKKLYELAETSPASLVIEVWNVLEMRSRKKVEGLLPADESFKDPLSRPIDYLGYKGVLSRREFSIIRDLRDLRNQAAHASSREISRQDALQYAEVAANIWRRIDSVTDLPKAKLTAFTLLVLEINCLIDSGKFNDITIDEVYGWIEGWRVIPALAERAKGEVDLSSYGAGGPYENFCAFYHEQMYSLAAGYAGDHRRKWGVENLGLCLLLAWTNELIQQGSGWYPNELD